MDRTDQEQIDIVASVEVVESLNRLRFTSIDILRYTFAIYNSTVLSLIHNSDVAEFLVLVLSDNISSLAYRISY